MAKIELSSFEGMSKKFREHRNFSKISAKLVDYGYMCSWLPVDNEGADFICIHHKTNDVLKIQLKGRVEVNVKYSGKNIYMAFPKDSHFPLKNWVIVPHDALQTIYISQEQWERRWGKSSSAVPEKIWNKVKELSIVEPLDIT